MDMSDDLDALLEEQEQEPPPALPGVPAVVSYLSSLGGEVPLFAALSPVERSEVVEQLETLRRIEDVARSRRRALELSIIRAADELDAMELRISDGSVRIDLPRAGYETHDQQLRQALLELVTVGDLAKEEVDAAIPETVIYRPDHRKLNALMKRGERVREAIESHRTKAAPSLLSAKVTVHRKGGL